MGPPAPATLFDAAVWSPALEKYGDVVRLSVALYDVAANIVCGPTPTTPVATMLTAQGYDPGLFADCATACLAQSTTNRPAIVLAAASGLAVVGVSLRLADRIVGAAVAGYALIQFPESVAIARLARDCGVPFQDLWTLVRAQQPIPMRRLVPHGELLQVLGDALLRENDLRRRSDEAAIELSHLASHDPLTNLPNRVLLADRLAHALTLAQRHSRRVAVLFLDIDRFKHVNDSLGHLAGDELLRTVSRELTRCVRSTDTVARQGGDEFVVVLSEVDRPDDAGRAAEKILAALAVPQQVGAHDLHISVSIGISLFPADGTDAETLLARADMALYHAKDQGRDRYQFFESGLNSRAVERQSIEAGLHGALDKGEFELAFQPKVNLRTGAMVGAEALIRWRHPERGLVAPDQFVPVAEDCGLIVPIGRWVVGEACRQARAWQEAGLPPIPVSVNVSAVEFRNKDFLQNITDVLTETALAPGYLEIELTESVLMAQVERTDAVLRALKGLGVQLSIDDFGTGFSSLSYLRKFPVDALKIDRSFVQEIASAGQTAPIVSAVINLGRTLDLRVIAEGVETRAQLSFLQHDHCDEAQGFFFSRPLFAADFAALCMPGGLRPALARPVDRIKGAPRD